MSLSCFRFILQHHDSYRHAQKNNEMPVLKQLKVIVTLMFIRTSHGMRRHDWMLLQLPARDKQHIRCLNFVFLHQTRLSDVVKNDLAPCPAVPGLFAVVDE